MKKTNAFTLIELLIVVAIMGVLAAVGIPLYNNYIIEAKEKSFNYQVGLIKKKLALSNIEYSTNKTGFIADLQKINPDNPNDFNKVIEKHFSEAITKENLEDEIFLNYTFSNCDNKEGKIGVEQLYMHNGFEYYTILSYCEYGKEEPIEFAVSQINPQEP